MSTIPNPGEIPALLGQVAQDLTSLGIWRITAGFILGVLALILIYDGVVVLVYGHQTSISNVMRWCFERSPTFFAVVLIAIGSLVVNHWNPWAQ